MLAGIEAHGLQARILQRHEPRAGETVVCWGWRGGQHYHDAGCRVLVMERGYIGDRFAWTSLGWNGLNNRGTMPDPPDDGGARFKEHHAGLLQPMQPGGEYVLLCGQVPGDMSLQGADLYPWYVERAEYWRARGKLVLFRPHPLAHLRGPVRPLPGVPMLNGELSDALAGAELVETFNSNTAVDALLAGKLISVADCGSMAWDGGDRERWAHRLAWRQFTMDEIRSGFAWSIANG